MASGFGTYNSNSTHIGGYTSIMTTAVVSQAVNTSARTVTATITAYAGYKRDGGGNWSVSDGTRFWRTDHSDSYMTINIDGTTGTLNGKIGVASKGAQTVTTGTICTVPNGKAKALSGYSISKTVSKTFNYDASGSAITRNWSITLHEYDSSYGWHDVTQTGSFTTSAISQGATAPTGLWIHNTRATYNSVSGTVGLDDYGIGTGQYNLELIVLEQPYVGGLPHRYSLTTSGTTYFDTTVDNNSQPSSVAGPITIKGAGVYYTGVWANNGSLSTRLQGPAVNTPPAPLSSLTYTQQQNATDVTVYIQTVGGDSSVNNSNNVDTWVRYSTDGGSNYTEWTYMGTGQAWNTYYGQFNCGYGNNIVIQTKQVYNGAESEIKSVAFAATTGVQPSGLTSSIVSTTWNTVTVSGSISSYGMPSDINGRKLAIGVAFDDTIGHKRENQLYNVTSGTTTVNNSSIYPASQPLNIIGMTPVHSYIWAWNGVTDSFAFNDNTDYTNPAPGVLTYSHDVPLIYAINYSGVSANNYNDYTASDLTRTVRYKIDNGAWQYIENAHQVPLTELTDYDVAVALGETLYVEAWMTYKGKNSEVSAFQIAGTERPVQLYGSVNDAAKEIVHFYGPVNGTAKKVVKIYGSVNGEAKEVFVDV